ncbi:actin-related protein 2/3 complex subunit 3-A-like [Halichondria panicea]|uniref:actin-related protein 2/3 complex subunit 3-A-like n=1 Tax=Halichondria panicea TaxID=6063 RepID=UPI00312B6390
MPAYHSSLTAPKSIAKMGVMPLKTKFKGPAPTISDVEEQDIIDEAIYYFKANVFFKSFEVKSDADRTLIYLTLYVSECLKKVQRSPSKGEAKKSIATLAVTQFDIPGDTKYPLNSFMGKPVNRQEADQLRQYMTQLRQELGQRLVDKVFESDTAKPSKWWLCFVKRRFMDKSLSGPGA